MGQGQLLPVSEQASPEARALAEGLRGLFHALDISIRRYATRCHCDAGTLSRYLNGSRVPPWSFVRDLITHVTEARQQPIKGEVFDHVRNLHRAALQTSNTDLYAVQILQDRLEDADREQQRAALREQALLEALQTRQQRVADLETVRLELEASREADRAKWEEFTNDVHSSQQETTEEIKRLQSEIINLKEQLTNAHQGKLELENRCRDLERQLESAETSARAGDKARESETLEEAVREAAEAKAELKRIQEVIDTQKREEKSRRDQAQANLVESEKRKEKQRQTILSKSPVEVAKLILRAEMANKLESHALQKIVAEKYPIEPLPDVLEGIGTGSDGTRIQLLILVADNRTPEEIYQLIAQSKSTRKAGRTLADELITWFSWERTGDDFIALLERLRGNQMTLEADGLLKGAATNQPPNKVLSMLGTLNEVDKQIFIEYIASERSTEKLPSLLVALKGYPTEKSTILKMMCQSRPKSARRLVSNLLALDLSEDALALNLHLGN